MGGKVEVVSGEKRSVQVPGLGRVGTRLAKSTVFRLFF
jgi:hypothetical protein